MQMKNAAQREAKPSLKFNQKPIKTTGGSEMSQSGL